jgi:hypothetical protein
MAEELPDNLKALFAVKSPPKRRKKRPGGKYHAIKSTDEAGNKYDSLLERKVTEEFMAYEQRGMIKDLKMQVPFSFSEIGLNRKYIADMVFFCQVSFIVDSVFGPVKFDSGKEYVLDVKSPQTAKDATFLIKADLMKCVLGTPVTVLVRTSRKPRRKKAV